MTTDPMSARRDALMTDAGRRVGVTGNCATHVVSHTGLRYATLSEPADPWSAAVPVMDAEAAGSLEDVPVFPQLPSRLSRLMGSGIADHPQDHNAFFLNVFAPRGAEGLPVVVFIHGGAWSSGGAVRWYRGTELAGAGLVVVTVNYRLGPAGHLGTGREPHQPLNDLVLALQWVRDGIGHYGGDAGNVTVAGQSAGAWYAWTLAQDRRTRGWLRRVALWSMPDVEPWSYSFREDFTREIVGNDHALLTDPARYQELMRGTMAAVAELPHVPGMMPPMLLPTVPGPPRGGGAGLQDAVRHLHVQQVYVRDTPQEMSPFLALDHWEPHQTEDLLQQLERRIADAEVVSPWPENEQLDEKDQHGRIVRDSSWLAYGRQAAAISAECRRQGVEVVVRRFGGRSPLAGAGSPHCFDLPFQFGNFPDWHDAPMIQGLDAASALRWSQELRQDLHEFVHGNASPEPRTLGT